MKLNFLLAKPCFLYYEGDTETETTENPDDKKIITPDPNKKFDQEEVNKFLAEDRKKHKAQVDKTVKELETLKKSKQLTEEEKNNLAKRIDELNNSILTKEELAKKEREKLETTHKSQVQQLTADRDSWQTRFVTSTINVAITGEAVKAEAFDVEDLIARLGPNTRLAEETDESGKGLGVFVPKVKFGDSDAEGKPVTLDLTVEQAVKRMKEMPKFAHLFKSTAKGGLGGDPGAGAAGGKIDFSKMTPEQYRKYREKNGMARKVGQ